MSNFGKSNRMRLQTAGRDKNQMLRGKDGSDKYYSDMLIILDFDGTIGDSQALIIGTMQQTMRELKLEVKTKEECARTIGLMMI